MPSGDGAEGVIVARRTIRATPDRLFAAWTQPSQLTAWWGPAGATCTHAEVDLRPGGAYRLANQFPDGRVVWITGAFELIEPPHQLVYTWSVDEGPAERVTVRFEARDDQMTDVVVVHDRIRGDDARRGHEAGWAGCLARLEGFAGDRAP
jgi:uncharacterized protein YndB with AHSA1/START domain